MTNDEIEVLLKRMLTAEAAMMGTMSELMKSVDAYVTVSTANNIAMTEAVTSLAKTMQAWVAGGRHNGESKDA